MPRIDTIVVHAGPQGPTGATGTNIYVQPGDPGSVADGTLWLDTDDTTPDTSLNWGNIAGTLSNQTDLQTALNGKQANLPTQTGNAGKYLQTDGTNPSWTTPSGVPTGGAAGQALVKNSATNGDVSWAGRYPPLPWPIGSYLCTDSGPFLPGAANNLNTSTNLTLHPIVISDAVTVNLISCNVATAAAAGTIARLGIFTYDFTSGTATRVADAGTVAVDSTGQKDSPAISQTLTLGVYWLAYQASASGSFIVATNSLNGVPLTTLGGFTARLWKAGVAGDVTGGFQATYTGLTATGQLARLGLRRSA